MGSIIIERVESGVLSTNAYLIGSKGVAYLIDPAPGSFKKVLPLLEKHALTLQAIYLTHSHFDHFADAHLFIEQFHVPLYVHEKDAPNVIKPGSDGLPDIFRTKPALVTGFIKEGDRIALGETSFLVIETPGHSPGGVSFYFEREKILFSGDTLFKNAHGRVDLPSSDREAMILSLERLSHLPEDVVVYSGHGDATTIEQEKRWICR